MSTYFPFKKDIQNTLAGVAIDRAFDFAWDLGHANGFDEVEGHFLNIVHIIRPLIG